MSLEQTGRHLASITHCDGIQSPTAAGSNRPHDVQAHATQSVITAYGMVWGNRSMSSKAETGLL